MNRSDAELVADHLSGNEKSLEVLIKRNLKPVYGFVYKYAGNAENSEDITQDVFVKMWKNLKRFDQNKNFRTWLFAIAKNSAIDFQEKKSRALLRIREQIRRKCDRRNFSRSLAYPVGTLGKKREIPLPRFSGSKTAAEIRGSAFFKI